MHSLMTRLEGYGFPLSDGTSLTRSLIDKDIVTEDRADTALMEYRRFLFLAATGEGPTVPSPLIDAIWHVHILDTRAYHDDLCAGVIGQVLHHAPGRPEARVDPGYAATLQRYAQVFGAPAHPGIWPTPSRLAQQQVVTVIGFLGFTALFFGIALGQALLILAGAALLVGALVWSHVHGPWQRPKGKGSFGVGVDASGCGGGGGGD